MENGNYAEAEACFRWILSVAPDFLETTLNLGYVLDMQGRSAEALECYESVLAAVPDNAKARYNRAAHLLRSGDFINGFTAYEARFEAINNIDGRVYDQPRWDGTSSQDRSILVHCEQGLGDAIMFVRYLPLLIRQGARVHLEVQEPLVTLLSLMEGVNQVVAKSPCPPVTDFHIPLLSLPFMFKTTLDSIPDQIPYLSPAGDHTSRWREKLRLSPQSFNVGLVWAGKKYPYPNRSCPPENLAPLLAIPEVCFYSLQVGEQGYIHSLREVAETVVDPTDDIRDFADTAALIANLDLVITIDTAVAHLAGAIGKPVWVMLPAAADWRWMANRIDSPWYPTMRLFRQPVAGDWLSVVHEIVRVLRYQLSQNEQGLMSSAEMQEISFQHALTSIANHDSDLAIPELRNLLESAPGDPAVWFNLGRAYDMGDRLTEAEHSYRQALLQTPSSPAIWFALGEIRLKQKAYPEAEFCLRKAHSVKPESIEILLSLGAALSAQRNKVAAFDCCNKILAIKPDCLEAIYNMSFIQLRNGDYKSGFANFEARLAIKKFNIDPRRYLQPRWDGSSLNGMSILIFGEQGMGDVIQFARYIPLVAERGGKVTLEVDPPLIPLFESFPGVERIIPKSKEPPLTDVYIQLLSLPYILGTTMETIPGWFPYLLPDAAKVAGWKQRLGDHFASRIGLVWRGNPNNPRDKERSCALNTFALLAGLPHVNFFSLQVGDAALEAASPPEGMPLTDYSCLLTDLTETAALIGNLDLVISVDTAVAHLAGAMGRQVWVLLPESGEWRWLEGRSDTPWYPTMRVFEHEHDAGWEGVVQRVRIALKKMLNETFCTSREVDAEITYKQGANLKEAGDLAGAEYCFRKIVELHPELPDPQHSLGVVLHLQGLLQEAVNHYRCAVTQDPQFVKAYYNLANALLQLGFYAESMDSAKTAIECEPHHADAHWLLGMLLLQQGDFGYGLQEYEWRWHAKEFTSRIPDLGRPLWDGAPLAGRTLLIHMEQGRGDMIQFIRYAPLAAALGGRVVVCALVELVSVLATVAGVDLVVDREGQLPEFDFHIPVQSLPRCFGTTLETIPSTVPYLYPPEWLRAKWADRSADTTGCLRVGLAWEGNRIPNADRSCPLEFLLPLLDVPRTVFYSLQVGGKKSYSYFVNMADYTTDICDFSDTAALILSLDLIISVDTAVAHLAGALGKQVWTMLPFVSDWRWLLDREDSPWYPSMRLFRQSSSGDWNGVISRIREELTRMVNDSGFHNVRGIELLKSGRATEAERAFTMALLCDPADVQGLCNKGVALVALQQFDEAIGFYRDALLHKPDFMQAMHNMANAFMSLGKPADARACYEQVLQLAPDFVPALIALGEIGKTAHDFEYARSCFKQVLELDPSCVDALQGLAEIFQAEENFDEAITFYKQTLNLDYGRVNALNMMGNAYHCLEQFDEAEFCYRIALDLDPHYVTALNNLGVVLNAQGRLEEAVAAYRQLLELDADYAEGHWNLATALLSNGSYSEGWREFEWRFRKADPVPFRHFNQPLWDGHELDGRTILLHAEQGFGDTIQFARFIHLVAVRGGNVIIECQTPVLKRLLLSLEGVSSVIFAGEPLPHFDCHVPLMSLPLLFDTTIETLPVCIPYLHPAPIEVELWKKRLGTSGQFRVGIVWFAKQSQVLNRKRSCPLKLFAPLWRVSGVEFYSLQIGAGSEQLREFDPAFPIIDVTHHINDFSDTAALVANLDLVITIDTGLAHLAGALGARTWVVLPHVAEWRWLQKRTDSPWYPTMRLFRQPSQGDWASLMENVATALRSCVRDKGAGASVENRPLLRVGLAWAGRQDNPLNRKRSCPFSALVQLCNLKNIVFVKLHMESFEESDPRIIDCTDQIRNFEDTAALMANLDLIISIDTSVAHLAAATGRPTWVLLPHVADWRWSTVNNTSVWYPAVRIFRQEQHGDWDGVIQNVSICLKEISMDRKYCHGQSMSITTTAKFSLEKMELERQLENNLKTFNNDTTCADALLDVGASLALLGRHAEAIDRFRKVLELDSEHIAGHLNLAYCLLESGEFPEGWHHFEWRLRRLSADQIPPWPFLNSLELGVAILGTSLLVHCEQGYGDTILFCRFLPLLADAGYRVIVSCQPPLSALVASVRGVSQIVEHGEHLPVCQRQVLMSSLACLFSATREKLPKTAPYLTPQSSSVKIWKARLKDKLQKGSYFSKVYS